MSVTWRFARILCVAALVTGGCGTNDERSESPPAAHDDAGTTAKVTLPDLSRASPEVQRVIRDRHAALTGVLERRGSAALERAEASGALGMILLAAGYLDAADACFADAAALAPGNKRWPYYRGHVFRLQNDPERAARSFERALELQPDDRAALLWLADMHLLQNHLDAAARVLERSRSLAPLDAAVHDGLGRLALARRDYLTAVDHFERAIAAVPQATRLHYPLGLAYRGAGDRARSAVHLERRGDIDVPRDDPLMEEVSALMQGAAAYELRGVQAMEEGRWTDAVTSLRRAVHAAPDNPVSRLNLGNALYQAGDAAGAIEQLRMAVQLSPRMAKAHYALGVLMEIDRRDREAIDAFSAAVTSEPAYVEARLALAEALRRTDRVEEALPHYRAVIERQPDLSQASFGFAMGHVRLRRYREARDLFERGMRTYVGQPGFAHALARLLAAAPDPGVRDGRRALALLDALMKDQQSLALAETMAMALAEVGRFEEAAGWQRTAIAAAEESGRTGTRATLARNLALYERREPCRTPWPDDDPVHRPRAQR